MDWMELLKAAGGALWTFANSGVGLVLAGGAALWLLNRLYAAKPGWKQYEGGLIRAVRWAEKEIPDGTTNKYLKRADQALKYIIRVFEEINGRGPTVAETAELKQGIEIVHRDLEASETL